VVSALKEILTHQQLRQCETGRPRYTAHLLIFYGFIGLLLMNVVVVVGLYGFGWKLPWAMDHPVKILAKVVGNLSGLAVVIGCLLAIAQRVRGRRATRQLGNWATGQLGNQPQSPEPNFLISQLPSASLGTSAYWDWLFVILLCAVAATGLVVEVSRLLTTGAAPYILYAVHLALVFFLIAYFPHSKFAHLIYRTVAKVHAKVYDRQGERGE
jgi:quinone-modifying oxidoreductase subunit QmoC